MRVARLVVPLLALALAAPAVAEDKVGVTAAVNPAATSHRGGAVRTIALGDNVISNERIATDASGLVQILLADGTTFMVGPNSNLVIDSFVYDPAANTASVTASLTKGVLRFIGGSTSKTGGATLNTPVGTVGFRGAIGDVVVTPPDGTPPHIDLLFGNEMTLSKGKDLLGRLYASGYSIALGPNGSYGVQKTPSDWSSQIQKALTGGPGTTGGAPKPPTDDKVKDSDVPDGNSGQGVGDNTPKDVVQPLTEEEIAALLAAVAAYEELRKTIIDLTTIPPEPFTLLGYSPGLVVSVDDEDSDAPDPFGLSTYRYSEGPFYTQVHFNSDKDPDSIIANITLAQWGCDCYLHYEGDTTTGAVTAVYNGEGSFTLGPFPTTGYLLDHSDPAANLPEDFVANCTCNFLRWGTWGFSASGLIEVDEEEYEEGSMSLDGFWVAGDPTTQTQLDALQSLYDKSSTIATYSGDALGNVSDINGTHVASGGMDMLWSFGARTGTIDITDFDGHDLAGSLSDTPGGFSGTLLVDNDSINSWGGAVQGSFANNGSSVAAGVMGDFSATLLGDGGDWSASGIFMGARGPDTFSQ